MNTEVIEFIRAVMARENEIKEEEGIIISEARFKAFTELAFKECGKITMRD